MSIRIQLNTPSNGNCILAATYQLGGADLKGKGSEPVFLYAKQLVRSFRKGARSGGAPAVFLDDPGRMPLEIGPVIRPPENRFIDAEKRPGDDTLPARRTCEMLVKYMNKPLPGAKVLVHSLVNQWERELVTDTEGKVQVVPVDDSSDLRPGLPRYLFVASYRDPSNGVRHIATLVMNVSIARHDGTSSKVMGFTLWAVGGGAFLVLVVMTLLRRRAWRNRRRLAIFRDYAIKEDL